MECFYYILCSFLRSTRWCSLFPAISLPCDVILVVNVMIDPSWPPPHRPFSPPGTRNAPLVLYIYASFVALRVLHRLFSLFHEFGPVSWCFLYINVLGDYDFQTPRGAFDAVTVTGDTVDRPPPAVVDSFFLLLFDPQHLHWTQNFMIYAATFSVCRGMAVFSLFDVPRSDVVHPPTPHNHRQQHWKIAPTIVLPT